MLREGREHVEVSTAVKQEILVVVVVVVVKRMGVTQATKPGIREEQDLQLSFVCGQQGTDLNQEANDCLVLLRKGERWDPTQTDWFSKYYFYRLQ